MPLRRRAELKQIARLWGACTAIGHVWFAYLLHEPSMTDHNGLSGQCVRAERCKKERSLSYIIDGSELAIHSFLQHDVLDHFLLRNAEFLRLLGNLLLDEWCADEPGTNHVGTDPMGCAFFGYNFRETDEAVLGGDVRGLQGRGLFRMRGAHVDDASAVLLVHLTQRRPCRQKSAV